MRFVLAGGPGLVLAPTAHDVRGWALVGLLCGVLLLADAAATVMLLRRNGSGARGPAVLLPAALAGASLLYAWRTWLAAAAFPGVPTPGGIAGLDNCALCDAMAAYAWTGVALIGATVFALLGSGVYLLGKLDRAPRPLIRAGR